MPRLKYPLLFTLTLGVFIASPVWGESVSSILSKLDQNYYYPQKQGLKNISVRVKWEQLDVASGPDKFLRNPDFIYFWKMNSDDGLGSFRLAEEFDTGDRFQELLQQIRPFRESIIPLTLQQKFSDFAGQVQASSENRLIVKLNSKTGPEISYKLLVDSKEQVIRKLRFQQTNSPESVEGEFSYLKLDGKYAISESRSRFEVRGQEYFETTRYTYKKVESIWWVHRIEQILKREDQVVQNYIFMLSDFHAIRSTDR